LSSIRTSLAYSFLNTNAVTALQFIASLIMARLLSPADFGVYTVAAVFIGIAQLLRDFGVTSYIVQTREFSKEMLRAAFGLMLILAWIIGLTLIGFSSAIAAFYREPAVRDIILVLALNFFVTPLGSITLAMARRSMRFRELAIIGIGTTIISITVTVVLAMRGHGAMSLAWGAVANTFTTFLFSLPLRTAEMSWLPSLRGIRPMLGFGGTVTSSNILGFINLSTADVILGRLMNMEAVGLFSRATSLNRYFATALNGVIGPVMLPWLSQLNRDGACLREVYEKITELVTGLTWPVYALIAILADPLIQVLFGSQWAASAELVPYLCLTAMISSTYTANGPVFLAKGLPRYNLLAESINLPLKVTAILLTAPHGLMAVAMGWTLVALASALVQQVFLHRELNVRLRDAPRYLAKSLALTLMPALLAWAMLLPLDPSLPPLLKLAAGGGIGFVAWLTMLRLVRHPLLNEIQKVIARIKARG
jgi:O-antigen/teichoic acid export membrane protein